MAGAPHLEAFLAAARYFVGLKESGNNSFTDKRGKELWNLWGWNASGTAWCAIFVSACAQKAGVAGKVIEKQAGAGWLQESTVLHCGGTWVDGPYLNGGKAVTPIPGDIISFSYKKQYSGHGHASHVGIVEYVKDNKVYTIEGNTGNACQRKSYALNNSTINCYVRPDWSRVGDDVSAYLAKAGQLSIGPLYQNRNDRHDMTLRQVGYIDSKYALTNSTTDIAISVINYTTALGDIYEMFAAARMGAVQVDTSKLTGNIKIAMDYLIGVGFSAASASAIVGCMKMYSEVLPTYTHRLANGQFLYGICAWEYDKMSILRDRVGYEWNINLSGQLEYFAYDLETNFNTLLINIKNVALGLGNVESTVVKFMTTYSKHFRLTENIDTAKNNAAAIYTSLIITQPEVVGNTTVLKDKNGNQLKSKKSVTVPTSVPQTGIIDDYTSYSCWFTRWNGKSLQRKLANIWRDQGYPCNKGVATIGGYYCVAVSPKFGTCDDVIVVTLEGGVSFAAIICDVKGDDAKSEWGHIKGGGKISIIEWQRVKTRDGKVVTGTGFTDVDKPGFGSWLNKKVINITNYGKYANVKWG